MQELPALSFLMPNFSSKLCNFFSSQNEKPTRLKNKRCNSFLAKRIVLRSCQPDNLPGFFFNNIRNLAIAAVCSVLRHVALAVKARSWLNLQFSSLQVASDHTTAFKLQEVFHLNAASYFAHDVGLLAVYITCNDTVSPNNNFCGTMDIALKSAINADVAVPGKIAF